MRTLGPLLSRRDVVLSDKRCFVSLFGLYKERGIVIHCVEPASLSVSVLPLGEAELRRVLTDDASGHLLKRWLGTLATPVSRRPKLTRTEWNLVADWLLMRLELVPARVARGSTVHIEPGRYVVAIPSVDADEDLLRFSRRAFRFFRAEAGVIDDDDEDDVLTRLDQIEATLMAKLAAVEEK